MKTLSLYCTCNKTNLTLELFASNKENERPTSINPMLIKSMTSSLDIHDNSPTSNVCDFSKLVISMHLCILHQSQMQL